MKSSEETPKESSEATPIESSEGAHVATDRELASARLARVGQNMSTQKAYGADIEVMASVIGDMILESIGDYVLPTADIYQEAGVLSADVQLNSAVVDGDEETYCESSITGAIYGNAEVAAPYFHKGENPEDFKYEKVEASIPDLSGDFSAYLRDDKAYLDASKLGDAFKNVMTFLQEFRPSEQKDGGERRLEEGSESATATPFGDYLGFYFKDSAVTNAIGTLPGLLGMGLTLGSSYILPVAEGETPFIPEFVWNYIDISYDPVGDLEFSVDIVNERIPSLVGDIYDFVVAKKEEEEVLGSEVESNGEPSEKDLVLGLIDSLLGVIDLEITFDITFGEDVLKSVVFSFSLELGDDFADVFNSIMKMRNESLLYDFSYISGRLFFRTGIDFFYGEKVVVARPDNLEDYVFLNSPAEEEEEEEYIEVIGGGDE